MRGIQPGPRGGDAFISRKKMFPVIGVIAGIAGGVLALVGVFV